MTEMVTAEASAVINKVVLDDVMELETLVYLVLSKGFTSKPTRELTLTQTLLHFAVEDSIFLTSRFASASALIPGLGVFEQGGSGS